VIARNSAFTYKAKGVDVKAVGQQLGVRYALEGSVRKIDTGLRVNVQLISTETGAHLWADRWDTQAGVIGPGQDDIVRRIGLSLNIRLIDIESARSARERPSNPDATDLILRARALGNQAPSREQRAEIIKLYERAGQLDP